MSPIKLPAQSLVAVGSGREIIVRKTGVPIVLIYHSRDTAEVARAINNALRDDHPDASELLIASIVDMHVVPKLLRSVTEGVIKSAYKDAASELDEGQVPEDYIIILVDWNGKMTEGAGFSDTNREVGLIVLDAEGGLVDSYQGDEPVKVARQLAKQAITG